MDKNQSDTIELLRELSLAFGPSGCEGNVADIIRRRISGFSDKTITDRLGNVIARINGRSGAPRRKLMISAHMDEVGFMITHFDSDGFAKISPVGGISASVMSGRRVIMGNEKIKFKGVTGIKPLHLGGGDTAPDMDSVYVDLGFTDKDDALKHLSPGDFGVFDSEFVVFGSGGCKIKGKALDDRFGCAVMIELMKKLYSDPVRPEADIYFAFTVREEVGLSGAKTAAYLINPDYAVALETTAVADIDGVEPDSKVALQGDGGVISIVDRSTIYDKDFINLSLRLAEQSGIKCQIKKFVSGGNDASHIQKTREGVKVLALSAPSRYIHTPANVIDFRDMQAISSLTYEIIKNIQNI